MTHLPRACLVRSSINVDEYLSVEHIVRPGETINSTAYSRRPGGKGANGAVALAKAGAQVSFAGLIGTDASWLRKTLELDHGVDVNQLKTVSELPTGRAIIQVARPTGENSIVLVPGANHAPHHHWPPLSIERSLYSHLLLQNEIPLAETCQALVKAHESGVCTVFNPSPLPSQSEMLEMIPWRAVDWLIINEEEGRALSSAKVPPSHPEPRITSESGSEDDQLDESVMENLIRSPLANIGIVLTLGARGCQVGFRTSTIGANTWIVFRSPAGQGSRPVIDTTGAGDCFTGYLVAQLMAMDDLSIQALTLENVKHAITIAGRAARICVENEGTIDSYPMLKDVI